MATIKDVSMTLGRALEIIENEIECVISADNGCDRDCALCSLVRPTEEILTAYEIALIGIKNYAEEFSPEFEVSAKVIKGSRARIMKS